jgi:DNA-binding transcriptional ArsR family regulator
MSNPTLTPAELDKITATTKKAAKHLRAINHKLRQQIIKRLLEIGTSTVTEMYLHLRLEQSVCSQHLRILRDAGIVHTKRDGKFIYYYLYEGRITEMGHLANSLNNK